MARARNVKPGFFTNDVLVARSPLARLLFIGLWTIADKEGRLEDRPNKIKFEILPGDDCDVNKLLNELVDGGFIVRYTSGQVKYIQVLNFTKHQNPHQKEAASTIPAPDLSDASTIQTGPLTDSPILIPPSPIPYPSPEDLESAVLVFNQAAREVGWPNCQRLTEPRKAKLKARLKDCGTLAAWNEAINRAKNTPFLLGQNDKGWKADFDFFLQEKSFTKLIEGSYESRPKGQAPPKPKMADTARQATAKAVENMGGLQ